MAGAFCSCWSTWAGGSNGQSQQMVKESKYSERQSDFKQISVIGACMTFAYWITWTSSRWNDVWGWVKNCVNRNEFISSDQRYSFQKNLRKPYMLGDIFTGVAKLFKMVHPSSRSKFWRLSWAKISKLFCGEIWKEIIWEITLEGIWISYLLLQHSSCIGYF